ARSSSILMWPVLHHLSTGTEAFPHVLTDPDNDKEKTYVEINRPVAVYISYVHESSGEDKAVHDLAERLRRDGVDCRLDESPSFEKSILESDFVLVICSPGYYKRFFDQQTGKQ